MPAAITNVSVEAKIEFSKPRIIHTCADRNLELSSVKVTLCPFGDESSWRGVWRIKSIYGSGPAILKSGKAGKRKYTDRVRLGSVPEEALDSIIATIENLHDAKLF